MKTKFFTFVMTSLLICGGFIACSESDDELAFTTEKIDVTVNNVSEADPLDKYKTFAMDFRYIVPSGYSGSPGFKDAFNNQYFDQVRVFNASTYQDSNGEYYLRQSTGTYWGVSAWWIEADNTVTEDQFQQLEWYMSMDIYLNQGSDERLLLNMEDSNSRLCEFFISWDSQQNVGYLTYISYPNIGFDGESYVYEFGRGQQSLFNRKITFAISQYNGNTYFSLPDYNFQVREHYVELNPFYFSLSEYISRIYGVKIYSAGF